MKTERWMTLGELGSWPHASILIEAEEVEADGDRTRGLVCEVPVKHRTAEARAKAFARARLIAAAPLGYKLALAVANHPGSFPEEILALAQEILAAHASCDGRGL